jgi:hypothetical protein
LKHFVKTKIFTKAGQAVSFRLANRCSNETSEPVVLADLIIHNFAFTAKIFLDKKVLPEKNFRKDKDTSLKRKDLLAFGE